MVLIFALSTLCAVSAQNRFAVRGRAVDAASREPVGYATAVLRRDSTVVSALAADAGGAFELTCPGKGRYRLEVTMVGNASLRDSTTASFRGIRWRRSVYRLAMTIA